jgi:hypothetical protein
MLTKRQAEGKRPTSAPALTQARKGSHMAKADSVHSTPPISTSKTDDPQSPTNAPESPQDSFYLPTDITPEELFQAIGHLRKEARDEIDRLIRFLDKTDDYVSREVEESNDDEPSLGWTTAGSQGCHCGGTDDLEAETEHDEDGDPAEPSMGALEGHTDQSRWARGGRRDLEQDGSESGIGDQDGLDEQVPFRDWQNVGMV